MKTGTERDVCQSDKMPPIITELLIHANTYSITVKHAVRRRQYHIKPLMTPALRLSLCGSIRNRGIMTCGPISEAFFSDLQIAFWGKTLTACKVCLLPAAEMQSLHETFNT